MNNKTKGTLIIIGGITDGNEEGSGGEAIMQEVALRAKKGNGCIGLVSAASTEPERTIRSYEKTFHELGVDRVEAIDIRIRDDAFQKENVQKLMKCSVIYFTGGDQLRLTSQVGDSPVF